MRHGMTNLRDRAVPERAARVRVDRREDVVEEDLTQR